ncbi:Taste receptor type 1 member 3 Sweet taste receptor T1R3 Precursor [Channa argus]|uniref:Taste receptor type 1 member 3 n=1 Tax=Channa argus TaxID=215402 RepID=A0A6G1PIA8_CHAAH|nr:Taste receptor type 1 member 3 Sweet taste receptor T1R3 Precursor [Channa argus]
MAAPFLPLILWFTIRLSCSVHGAPEWFQNISTSLFNLSGDIMLGGLFPLNQLSSNLSEWTDPDSVTCESLNQYGLGLAIVMKYAVDEINANQTLLPGIKLGYKIYDTCKQSAIIVKPTLSFLTAKANQVLSVECNYTNYETSISAVIGPQSSEMVSVIGKLFGFFLMPQISYGATSDRFSDNISYPSFFRTVPSDIRQVQAMTNLLSSLNWTWVAVVGSDEEYGQQGVQQFSKYAEASSICVAYQGLIPVYSDPLPTVATIINNIQLNNVGVVILFSIVDPAVVFFKEVIRRNVTGVWIASTSWAIHNRLTSLPNMQSVGTIIGFIDKTQPLDLLTAYTQELFIKMSEERKTVPPPAAVSENPTNPCPQCWNLSLANISLVTDPAVQHTAFSVYAATYAAAQALHNLLGCNSTACMWGSDTKIYPWKLLGTLRNTSVDIVGTHLVFDSSGNPNTGYNLIQWIWKNSGVNFSIVGSYDDQLFVNMSLFKWQTKNREILYVTEFTEKAASHMHLLRGPGRWLVVLVCCAVQSGLCGWFVVEGPSLSQYVQDMQIDFVRSFLTCPVLPLMGLALMQGFNTAMALVSFMCTFMAPRPLHQYNLSRDITFSSLIYCVLWVTFIPIYISLNDKNRATVYISFVLISNLGLVVAYYFPKCYSLLKEPDLNKPEHFCTFLEGVPPTPAEDEPQPQSQSDQ